jgi:hypothetical protein
MFGEFTNYLAVCGVLMNIMGAAATWFFFVNVAWPYLSKKDTREVIKCRLCRGTGLNDGDEDGHVCCDFCQGHGVQIAE